MKDLLENLQLLDIPRREAEVYLALLQKKEFTAPEIAQITSVSRTKSYEILENLTKKGLCNQNYKNGIKVFSCIDPKIVIGNKLSEYEEKKKIADQLQKNLSEIYKTNEHAIETLDYIEVISDYRQIKERWLKIQRNTKYELLMFTKPPYTAPLEDNIKEESKLLKKTIIDKSIYEYKSIKDEQEMDNLIATIEAYEKIGEEARIVEELPMKLAISDETITMLALNDRISMTPTLTTMIIDHPNFSKAQKKVFESYWESAISIKEFKRKKKSFIK